MIKYINVKRGSLIMMTLLLLMVFGSQAVFAETLKGRDYADRGELKTLNGNLIQIGDEWGLRVGDTAYEIHMGPIEFRESKGIILTDGQPATVKGFVYKTDIAAASLETGGKYILLRGDDGKPAWSGTRFSRGAGR